MIGPEPVQVETLADSTVSGGYACCLRVGYRALAGHDANQPRIS